MQETLEAVALGIVQGLTEFLPVSSTGHLVLTSSFLGIDEDRFGLRFDAAIHLGTLAAVLLYFRAILIAMAVAWFRSILARDPRLTPDSRLAWLILLGTLPAGIAGFLLQDFIEDNMRDPAVVAGMLILFCVPMLLAERLGRRSRDVGETTPLDALLIGCAQAVALIPGVSRSGITISTGMFVGLRREQAATFTFLLSAPIIAAAGGSQLVDVLRGGGGEDLVGLHVYATGLITAGIVGYAAVAFLLRFLRTNSLHVFVAYRVVLGLSVLGLALGGVL